MDLIRHVIVDTKTGKVVNVIEYETEQTSVPPGFETDASHLICIANNVAGPGWDYIQGKFIDNRPKPKPIIIPEILV